MSDENLPKSSAPLEIQAEVSTAEEHPVVIEPAVLERIAGQVATRAIMISRESFSGPMPSPEMFSKYEKVLPGTAKIIRDEFQANASHVREQEKKALEAQIENDSSNRHVAKQLVWGAFALIALTALTGHESVAIALSVTTIIGIIGGFLEKRILGKRSSSEDQPE